MRLLEEPNIIKAQGVRIVEERQVLPPNYQSHPYFLGGWTSTEQMIFFLVKWIAQRRKNECNIYPPTDHVFPSRKFVKPRMPNKNIYFPLYNLIPKRGQIICYQVSYQHFSKWWNIENIIHFQTLTPMKSYRVSPFINASI